MIRYDEALARIAEAIGPLPAVERPPLDLLGCHLAAPLVAPIPLPPCDDAAMDGWAVRGASTQGASRERPVVLGPGEAIPIATGDPMPDGMDTVLPLEWGRSRGEAVEAFLPVEPGRNVRLQGEDVQAGETVAPAGLRIDAGLVMAAASLGLEKVRAHARVRCAVLPVGHHLAAGRPDATGPAVVAAVRAWGADAELLPPATGTEEEVAERMRHALADCDWLITAGAASVGSSDVVPAAVERLGARLLFHGVSVKPGKPVGVATWEGRALLLLPGSPTAALACLEGIGRTVHARLAGAGAAPAPVVATLARPIARRRGKTGLLRGFVQHQDGSLVFLPAARQGPSQVMAVVGQNALARIPPDVGDLPAGARLEVLLLEAPPAGGSPQEPAAAGSAARTGSICTQAL